MKSYRSVRLALVREATTDGASFRHMRHGEDIARLACAIIADDPREHFLAFYLDGRNRLIGVHTVSVGVADATLVHPREVFMPAIALAACGLVVCHNHNGKCDPSGEDRNVTARIRAAGELLGIQLLDHVITGEHPSGGKGYFSFADEACHAYQ